MRKSDIRSSLVEMFMLFIFFERFILIANKELLRCWTLKQRFNFEKWRESLRRWTLKRSQVIFDERKFGCELIFSFLFFITFQSH